MMPRRPLTWLLLLLLLRSLPAPAEAVATRADCRPLEIAAESGEPVEFGNALLWEIRHAEHPPSYLFGTIHVADSRITQLPEPVSRALQESDTYVMEALPEIEGALAFSQMMFFDDGRRLGDFINEQLLLDTQKILADYGIPPVSVQRMKPWGAFLTMNYPAEEGIPLDLHLLHMAQQNGARLQGLESLREQGEIFANMPMDKQVRMLLDTVCNYETVSRDFDVMKSLWLQRDLAGLYHYSNRYTVTSESLYTELLEQLLFKRNDRMVERLKTVLEKGNAFIAVGAMHLPGEEGILSILDENGYTIKPIY